LNADLIMHLAHSVPILWKKKNRKGQILWFKTHVPSF